MKSSMKLVLCLSIATLTFTMFASSCKKKNHDNSTSSGGGNVPSQEPVDPTPRKLTVTKSGTGSGTIVSSPAGISCGNTCSDDFSGGAKVSLSISTMDALSQFGGWGGACSGTGSCTVAMDAAKSVTATFNPVDITGDWSGTNSQGYPLSFHVSPTGVTSYSSTVTVHGYYCTDRVAFIATYNTPRTITNFEFKDTGGDLTLNGSFSSGTTASGSFSFQDHLCGGNASVIWTAMKSTSGNVANVKTLWSPGGPVRTVIIRN